jgi:non-heme chloroperoxidase
MMMRVPLLVVLACRATIAFADLRVPVAGIDRPTLIVQGDKDASAPLPLTGLKTAKLVRSSRLSVYEGRRTASFQDRFIDDVVNFIGI